MKGCLVTLHFVMATQFIERRGHAHTWLCQWCKKCHSNKDNQENMMDILMNTSNNVYAWSCLHQIMSISPWNLIMYNNRTAIIAYKSTFHQLSCFGPKILTFILELKRALRTHKGVLKTASPQAMFCLKPPKINSCVIVMEFILHVYVHVWVSSTLKMVKIQERLKQLQELI